MKEKQMTGMMTGLQLLVLCVSHDMGTPGSAGLARPLKCPRLHRKIKIKKVKKGRPKFFS